MKKKPSSRVAQVVADLDWYALRVVPQKEFVAQTILHHRGIVTFCPAEHKWRRRNKYTKQKELRTYPLMVRYVFAGFVPGIPAWFNLFSIPIIQSVVGVEGRPIKICGRDMARIIGRFQNGLQRPDDERYMRTHREFKRGELVRIVDGPFDGMEVPVIDIRGAEARVVLELFGAEQEVGIQTWALEAA